MSILYLEEHCSCFNYSINEKASISNQIIRKGKLWEISPIENTLIFVISGKLSFSYKKNINRPVSKGKIILVTSNSQLKALAQKETTLTLVKIPPNIQLCDRYSFEKLLKESSKEEPEFSLLDINKEISDFIKTLRSYMNSGLNCSIFFDIKITELFFIFRGLYKKEDLYNFFYPLLSNDITFSDFVQKNYQKAKSVKELAEMANYSLSGFVKRFKKVFGMSAYKWMKEKKAALIYHEINNKTKTLKEICFEYGFSSPAHLNDFCKIHFNNTPGNIRKNKDNASTSIPGELSSLN